MRLPTFPMWTLIAAIWAPVILSNTTIASRLWWIAFSFVTTIWLSVTRTSISEYPLDRKLGNAIAFLCFGSLVILGGLESLKTLNIVFEPMNSIFEFVFPFMRKLNNLSGVNQEQIVKARTLNSFCLFSAAIMLILALKNKSKLVNGKFKDQSNFKVMISCMFCVLLAVASFFGFGEFDPQHFKGKFCVLNAYCYIGDDLAIVGSALIRTFVIFVSGVGSICLLYKGLRRYP